MVAPVVTVGAGLTALGITAAYATPGDGQPVEVLSDVNATVEPGVVLGVVGPNGAGKSSLIRALTGRLPLRAGEVTLDGRPVRAFGSFELARHVAVVAQAPVAPVGFTVREVVEMGRAPHLGLFGAPRPEDELAVSEALRVTSSTVFASRRVETLSGGELQRVFFARALAQRPKYLLLDEPTNHLDLKHQVDLLRYARSEARRGVGVLAVLHDLNLAARSCDRLLVLAKGRKVAEGAPAEVLTRELVGAVFGANVRVIDDAGTPIVVPEFAGEALRLAGEGSNAPA